MSKLIAHIRARTVVQKAASLLDLDEMDITGDDRDPVLCEVRYAVMRVLADDGYGPSLIGRMRSEEHTSELQSLMRISYAVFCLKKKNTYSLQKSIPS